VEKSLGVRVPSLALFIANWQLNRTGTVVWASQVGDWPELSASPVISGGKVYIVSGGFDSSRMYAFDALTGATVWVGEEEGLEDLNSAAVGHGLVFASMDGIVAYDDDTGEVVWHALDGQYVRASQTLKGNVLYVATFEGQLYALDAGTGKRAVVDSRGVLRLRSSAGGGWRSGFPSANRRHADGPRREDGPATVAKTP
jgi:outer membrane protein assembly factor BamB